MNTFGLKEIITQFDNENGGLENAVYLSSERWYYFPTGANREAALVGLRQDPPADLYEKSKKIARFWQLKLQQATEQFQLLKRQLTNDAASGMRGISGAPSLDDFEKLKALQEVVKQAQVGLFDAKETVEKNMPAGWKHQLELRQKRHDENRRANEAFLEKLKKLEV